MSDLLLPCSGGPTGWLRVPDPAPFEIERHGCLYVLDDVGDELTYIFVPRIGSRTSRK